MNFCSNCGAPVVQRIPPGDTLPRFVCERCGAIHYQNPKMVVGCIPEWEDRILLCRRAIEPRYGLWTVPAGFMENGETTAQGAQRETLEEANARVDIVGLYALYNIPHINQVYILFRARLADLNFSPGAETLDVRLFREQELPWNEIAFASVRNTLTHYFADRRRGEFRFHMGTIEPMKAARGPLAPALWPDGTQADDPQEAPAAGDSAGSARGAEGGR
jgi:ADP-ribose pyrophosphatase YjhB (NUDIX family)